MELRDRLKINPDRLDAINNILLNPDMDVINDFLAVVEKYGTPEEINAKADQARDLDNLLAMVEKIKPEHLEDLKYSFLSRITVKKSWATKLTKPSSRMNLQSHWRSAPASTSRGCV